MGLVGRGSERPIEDGSIGNISLFIRGRGASRMENADLVVLLLIQYQILSLFRAKFLEKSAIFRKITFIVNEKPKYHKIYQNQNSEIL